MTKETDVYFARGCRGNIVQEIQQALSDKDYSKQVGTIDGIYGKMTEKAVYQFQEDQKLVPTGRLDEGTWSELMNTDFPSVFRRCFQLTTAFEGYGYTTIAGNFDNQGLSFGCLQWNLGQGTLQPLLNKIPDNVWSMFDGNTALEPLVQNVNRMLLMSTKDEQVLWADAISVGHNKYKLDVGYEELFVLLGQDKAVQQLQRKSAKPYWAMAKRDAKRLGMTSDIDMALLFDSAVQNGGVKAKKAIVDYINYLGSNKAETVALLVANRSERYSADVLARKMTIANGQGRVHGREYDMNSWALTT